MASRARVHFWFSARAAPFRPMTMNGKCEQMSYPVGEVQYVLGGAVGEVKPFVLPMFCLDTCRGELDY